LTPAGVSGSNVSVATIGGTKEREINVKTVNEIINRHMARLLEDLEDAQCPRVYHGIVKSAFVWLRDDVTKNERGKSHASAAPEDQN
jgi:hypothetical protein